VQRKRRPSWYQGSSIPVIYHFLARRDRERPEETLSHRHVLRSLTLPAHHEIHEAPVPMSISVIIPTLNEAIVIAEPIRSLRSQHPGEIIVVDGGSADGTVTEARAADRVLATSPGRALQMNAGATVATGNILLFLHADCTLEVGALADAARLL